MWLIFGWISWRFLDRHGKAPETPDKTDDTLFIQAQTEYLKGEFTQAELLLSQRLQTEPRDAEARLLLVSLYRRSERHDKARHQLANLQRLDASRAWKFEIAREQQFSEEQLSELADDPINQDEPSSEPEAAAVSLGDAAASNGDDASQEDIPPTQQPNEQPKRAA